MNNHTAFTIPLFGGIPVPESVVVTWGIMAFLVILVHRVYPAFEKGPR